MLQARSFDQLDHFMAFVLLVTGDALKVFFDPIKMQKKKLSSFKYDRQLMSVF